MQEPVSPQRGKRCWWEGSQVEDFGACALRAIDIPQGAPGGDGYLACP